MPFEAYSTTPASNNGAPPNGAPEGMLPSAVNDVIRQVMADAATITRQYPWLKLSTGLTVARNSATQFQITGSDQSLVYTVGRRLREVGASTVYGAVSAVAFTAGNTIVDVTNDAAAAIPSSLTAVDVAVVDATAAPTVSLAGLNTISVHAKQMDPTTTNGCAPLAQTELVAGQPEVFSLDFDGTNQEFALFDFPMPKRWNLGTVTARFTYTVNAAVGTTVKWNLQAVAVSDNDAIATAYGTLQSVTDTFLGTANKEAVTAMTPAITIAGSPAVGDRIYWRVARDPANDTTDGIDAKLQGVEIFYASTTNTDA